LDRRSTGHFDRFQIPFRAVATDIATGNTVSLSKGDLAKSLRASMAVPGAFEPVEINGKMLIDGGVSDQLPVDIAKQMGADVIIAVNIGTPLKAANELESVLEISDQLTNIMTNKSVFDAEKLLSKNDVLITPDLEGFTSMDFSRGAQEIEIGIKAALAVKDKLSRYSVSDAVFSEYLKKQRRKQDTQYEFIEVKTPFGNFHENIKKSDDIQKIIDNRLIGRLFFRNMEFEAVDFTVIEKNGKKGLLLKTESKGKKPDQLKFGMEIEDDIEGDANYNVLLGYTMNSINRLGADWKNEVQIGQTNRIFSEFYQPVSKNLWTAFAAPWFEVKNSSVYVYEDASKIAEYRTREITGEFDIGAQLGQIGEIRFGVTGSNVHTSPKIAPSGWPDEEYDDAAYDIKLKIDTLNSLDFPRYGIGLNAEIRLSREHLGADTSYDMYQGGIYVPFTFGNATIMPRIKAGVCQGLNTDLEDVGIGYFTLGGFQNLSGLYPAQIMGNQMLFGEMFCLYKVWELSKVLGKNVYIGFSAEAGNVWKYASERSLNDLISAGSVFAGLETIVGPIYLAYGQADNGQSSFYFYLGHMY